jgi:hypothetical protein
MKRQALIAVWLGGSTIAAFGQAPAPASSPLLDEKRLVLQIEQVALSGTTNIFSDPAKPGTYVIRQQLAPNTKTRPRFHDHDRWVTVLKGTWWVGEGDVFRMDRLVPVREGGMMYQPANLRTFDVAGESPVVLQITGAGPVKSTHAEVDGNGKPVAIGGPYPEDAVAEATGRGYGRGGRGRGGRRGQPPPATQPQNPQQQQQQQQQ